MKHALASEATVEASLAELDRTVERMKAASARSIASSEEMARTARSARPSRSNPQIHAVRVPPAPSLRRTTTQEELDALDPADLTSRFDILKRGL